MVDITDSTPPVNIEVEEAILGGILLDPEAYGRVKSKISIAMFSIQAHRIIYKVMVELEEKEKRADLMGVSERLAALELLDTVGHTTKLGQLLNRTVSAVNIDRYAEMLFDKWKRRELIKLGHELVDLGYEQAVELPDLVNRVKAELEEWIGSDEEEKEEPLMVKVVYTIEAPGNDKPFREFMKVEAEIDLNKDEKEQFDVIRDKMSVLFKE